MISALKRCSVLLYLQLFVGGSISYLRYLCLLTYSGVQHILCCVFCFVLSYLCLNSEKAIFLSMLPVSLECPFLIVPSVFSNVYLQSTCGN